MRLFERKYVKIENDAWNVIREAVNSAIKDKEDLTEYLKTGLSPNEIHMMSERLTEFELAGIEPSEAKILADRNKIKPAEIVCGMAMCPVCGRVISAEESLKNYPICSRCGQRVAAGNAE